jgi:hypothetical protein
MPAGPPKPSKAFLFRPAERKLILCRQDEWDSLKGRGKERNEDGDLVNPRDELVDELVQELLVQFPERDISQTPRTHLTFTAGERDMLHSVRWS